jgi:TPR repeat protein
MRNLTLLPLIFVCALTACSKKENALSSVADIAAVRANLAFTCVHEADHLPPLDPDADRVFKYGRYLEKLDGPKDFDAVARYYRIAAAHGHYKANHNVQMLLSEGFASSPYAVEETIDLVEQLIKQGVPSGYYDMGYYLTQGYGVKLDEDKARRYFRKAADLGNPDAQNYVGDMLTQPELSPEIGKQMLRCAMEQGHALAAKNLAMQYKVVDKNFVEAVKAFQMGVKAGNSESASFLEDGFKAPPASEQLNYMGLPNDPERSRRYEVIWQFLIDNDGRNPKVPDIDQIVPLPPATLPPWDGTFQWQKEQDAAVTPQKPADELIERLSKDKNLDPATGLPMTTSASKSAQTDQSANVVGRLELGTVVRSGAICPQSGVWCGHRHLSLPVEEKARFRKGETMPQLVLYRSRAIPLLDDLFGMRRVPTDVAWKLVSYVDQA